jgi:DNA-directed RNA polymerase specialized sigma24 family protein
MSRPLAAKGGGACPSMFSTPGSRAQFAREIVNALEAVRFSCDRAVQRCRERPRKARAGAQMSLSSSGPAASLPSSATGDAPASTAGDGDERIRMQQLYRQHSSSLVRQLTRKTGCRELARELANETFLRLLRMAPGNLDRIEQPEAFLRRVSTNLIRDWGRAKALRERSQLWLELVSDQQLDQVALLESSHSRLHLCRDRRAHRSERQGCREADEQGHCQDRPLA